MKRQPGFPMKDVGNNEEVVFPFTAFAGKGFGSKIS